MRVRCLLRAAVTGLLCLWPAADRAQDVSIPDLKAAFLMTFVKFADWPEGSRPVGQGFTFCVAGDPTVFEALDRIVKNQAPRQTASVAYLDRTGPFDRCDVLFLGGLPGREWRAAIASLQHAPVLTVSDVRGFAESGGIAELKLDDGRMRFNINAAAARRGRIALSSKLLSLATLVQEKPDARR
jgi:hypothetical protein